VEPEALSDIPPFATRDEAARVIQVLFAPPIEVWDLTMPRVTWSPEEELLTRFGALPRTMHFGLMEVDLRAGEVRFWDQDHRDGADDLLLRAVLPQAWADRIRALEE
jgi:hypothetical protein